MDSTAKVLKKMNGTQFENICGPILRKMIPELKSLIPSGINIEGSVIKSLADGFCFVDQTHYATVHITTNTSNLQKKWLYDGDALATPKGDLIKSINQAREMHRIRSDFRFDVFLIYNGEVDNNLHIKVNQSIKDEFVSVKIIELRELTLFLDHDAEGQYLRKHLLGIDAVRISESLLKDIIKTNLSRYAEEIHLDAALLTETSMQKKVETDLKNSTKHTNLLVGESGFGKSTLCYAIMQSISDKGGVVYRVKQSAVEKGASFRDVIQIQLKEDYPNLFVQDNDINALFPNAVIVIDDINKSNNPSSLIDKIISWDSATKELSVSILCPVWPRNLNTLDNLLLKKDKFSNIALDRLSFYDCKSIIQHRLNNSSITLTDQQIHSLIIDTGFDPLLISFSLELLQYEPNYNETLPGKAIDNYISDQIKQVQNSHQVFQIKRTLDLFGKEILRNRSLEPHISEVENWFGRSSEEMRLINAIAAHRKLFLFDDEGKIYFRHDRVRDRILVLSATDLFKDFGKNSDILNDPHYAEIIGASLAISEMIKERVDSLVKSNPLAVFYSLKFMQENEFEDKRKIAMDAIQNWRTSIAIELVPKAIIEAIVNALASFDVKEIQAITQGFPKSAQLDFARFRTGIWLSAIYFFSSVHYFYPEAPTYWWNSILAHVKAKYLDEIIKDLSAALLVRFTPEGIVHAYTFVGFLYDRSFVEPLVKSWTKFKAPRNYPTYLWAIFNSSSCKDREVIVYALSYWSTLTVEEKSTKLLYPTSISKTIYQQIRRTPWKFSDEMFSLLTDISENTDFHEILALILIRIDHPRAIEIVLNVEMQDEKDEQHMHDAVAERWNPENTGRKLSDISLKYLLQEFSNLNNTYRRRFLAWTYWIENIDEEVALSLTKFMNDQSDPLFESVLIWRAKHQDITVLQHIQDLIIEKPWMVRLLATIWNEETHAFFLSWLDHQLSDIKIDNLNHALYFLQRLDNKDACKILVDHWDKLKSVGNAIETALFLSSAETRELADKEIKRLGFVEGAPMPTYYTKNMTGSYFTTGDELSDEKKQDLLNLSEQFRYLHMHYGIKYRDEKQERLTRTKVESLLPYLTLFDSYSIYDLATKCQKIGAEDLCYNKFYPLLDGDFRSKIKFTKEDLQDEVFYKYRQLVREKQVNMGHWFDNPEGAGITSNMLADVLHSFSKEYHDEDAFFIVTLILERHGTRKDISIINNFFLDFSRQSKEVNYWKENAIFSIKKRSLN